MLFRSCLRSFSFALVGAVCVMLTGARSAGADIINVPDDYDTIQEAIEAANGGDEIIVAPGTYGEHVNFLGKAVNLHSSDGADVTIIDATGLPTSVLTCIYDEGSDTIISGFTLTGGIGTLTRSTRCGGGMYNAYFCSPTIVSCTFVGNSATHGGGMYNDYGCSPRMIDCTFTGNSAQEFGGGLCNSTWCSPVLTGCTFAENTAEHGAGMCNFDGCCPVLAGCVFSDNTAGLTGGGMHSDFYCDPILVGCTFSGNRSLSLGGGMYTVHNSTPILTGCVFRQNQGDFIGGAMYSAVSPVLTGCAFIANWAYRGGGLYNSGSPVIVNCTFGDNEAGDFGDCFYNKYNSHLRVVGSILWNGENQVWNEDDAQLTITYSCVQGGSEGEGNIDADPVFVDPENGDYHLSAGSPCIDAGANSALPADSFDLDDDGDTAERVPLDLDGNPRFADDPDTADSGCGEPVIVDMGAYEHPGDAWHPMRIGDIDGNGIVNTTDLLVLLAAWGGYEDDCVLADLDYSGAVDTGDLLALLANWG